MSLSECATVILASTRDAILALFTARRVQVFQKFHQTKYKVKFVFNLRTLKTKQTLELSHSEILGQFYLYWAVAEPIGTAIGTTKVSMLKIYIHSGKQTKLSKTMGSPLDSMREIISSQCPTEIFPIHGYWRGR